MKREQFRAGLGWCQRWFGDFAADHKIGEFRLAELSPSDTRFDWYERIDAPQWLLALIKPGIILAVKFSLSRFARSVRR